MNSRKTRKRVRRSARALTRPPGTPVFWLSMVLLTLAFVLGGTGWRNPLSIMVLELFGVGLLALLAWSRSLTGPGRVDALEAAVLGGIVIVPLLQLIPLPPALWTALPGRDVAVDTMRLAGITPGWAPLSLDPEATFRNLLWLVPPLTLFLAIRGLDLRARFWLAGAVLILCVASLVLGGLQVAAGFGALFGAAGGGGETLPTGFFANRNHQGIAMAVALPFAAAFAAIWASASPHRTRAATMIYAALVALLLVGVLVTRSRAGVILAGPALLASFGIYWAAKGAGRLRRELVLSIGAGAVALVLAAQFAISAVYARFETLAEGDGRFDIWTVTMKAAADVAPVGAGLGTFEPFYPAWEPVALTGSAFVNHAHNEYMELWLEAGLLAPVVLLIFVVWLVRAALRAWSGPGGASAALARAGGVAVLLLLAHSVVDYPLRTQALACVFAFAAGCLARGPGRVALR